ncbi:MAG: hypothetical protein LBQ84_03405 [Flavobacteriaceae bacterium]|jgi:hypothetical protein|nr:hypothetical protein [Flavobacteriaceae bacterium]
MKLKSEQTKNKVAVVNIIVLIIFFTSLIFSYLDIAASKNNDEIALVASMLILIYLSYLGSPGFRYDSEGETLIFRNDKALPISFLTKDLQSDFPKRKLKKFNVKYKPLFKKKLEIYIYSKRASSGLSKLDFDISYLTKRQVRDLKTSLKKVLKENSRDQDIITESEYQEKNEQKKNGREE